VEYAARRTSEVESSLIQQGVPPGQAAEMMREEWAFLRSETDVPPANAPGRSPALSSKHSRDDCESVESCFRQSWRDDRQ
jgi:hypothetical protein